MQSVKPHDPPLLPRIPLKFIGLLLLFLKTLPHWFYLQYAKRSSVVLFRSDHISSSLWYVSIGRSHFYIIFSRSYQSFSWTSAQVTATLSSSLMQLLTFGLSAIAYYLAIDSFRNRDYQLAILLAGAAICLSTGVFL